MRPVTSLRGFPYNNLFRLNLSMSSTSFGELFCVIRARERNSQFGQSKRIMLVLFLFFSREIQCVRDTCSEMILQINDEKFIAFFFESDRIFKTESWWVL